MTKDDSEADFLGRWSRRKRAAEAAQPDLSADLPVHPEPEPEPEAAPETVTDAELAALPRIEDVTEGSDITGFLRPGVPQALKNAALRRIWMATPAIRDYRDPAVDYAWDWNTPGGVPGDGGAPAPDVAARMLRGLFEPREPMTPPEVAAVEVDPRHGQPEGLAPLASEDAPADVTPDPVRSAAIETTEHTASEGPEPDLSLPRRRHGGALPA